MNTNKVKIEFDFTSTGLWENTRPDLNIDWEYAGITKRLGNVIEMWNDIFDHLVCADNNKWSVTKKVADMMKPLGIALAEEVKKQRPDLEVVYSYYVDGKRDLKEQIEIKGEQNEESTTD